MSVMLSFAASLTVALTILNAGSFKQNGNLAERQSSQRKLNQCKSSCKDLIASSSENLKSLLTSTTLATLFLLRDSNITERDRQEGYSNIQNQDLSTGSRPRRLPPVFEILVGEIEGIGLENHSKRNDENNNTIHMNSLTERGKKKSSLSSTTNDVIWSRVQNQHRMKTLNEEWEGALRWIAGWGLGSNDDNNTKIQSGSEPNGGRRQRSRNQELSDHPHSSGFDGTGTVSAMFDVCVDECLKKRTIKSQIHQREQYNLQKTIRKISTYLWKCGIIIFEHKMKLVSMATCVLLTFVMLKYKSKFIALLIGRSNQVAYWLAIVGEDEPPGHEKSKRNFQRHKLSGKKSKKKRATNHADERKKKPIHTEKSTNKLPSAVVKGGYFPSSKGCDIDDSKRKCGRQTSSPTNDKFFKNETKRVEIVLKNRNEIINESSVNKTSVAENKWKVIEKTPPKASLLMSSEDTDACVKGKPIQLRHHTKPFLVGTIGTKPKLNENFHIQVPRTNTSCDEASMTWPDSSASSLSHKSINDCDSLQYNGSIAELPLHNRAKNLSIPTEKEREEASRKLRAFQIAQVSRLMKKNYKMTFEHEDYNLSTDFDWKCAKPFMASSMDQHTLLENKRNTKDESDAPFEILEEHLSGNQLLLSNMLDEDEEEDENISDKNMDETSSNSKDLDRRMCEMGSLMNGLAVGSSLSYSNFISKNVNDSEPDWNKSRSVSVTPDSNSWGTSDFCRERATDIGNVWT